MTTAADDTAVEDAFEAFLAGRPAPEGGRQLELAAFAEAVRATATLPGRPNAALAELLATGLLTDQSSPSTRTAPSAGTPPSRASRIRRRRRFAVFFPALIAKFLSAGAVAQAATGAGVVLVAFTGAGAAGVLPDPVQDTFTSVVGSETDDETTVPEDTTADGPRRGRRHGRRDHRPGGARREADELDRRGVGGRPGRRTSETFGEWVSLSAHNAELREWLRADGDELRSHGP